MTKPTHEKPRRSVIARRTLMLGTTIATAALGTGVIAAPAYPGIGYLDQISFAFPHSGDASVTLVAGGEGEGGEGEGATPLDPDVALLRDLGLIEAHLLAGLALYDAGDIAAAVMHMDQPVSEIYDTVSDPLTARGQEQLRDQLANLAAAAQTEASLAELTPLAEAARATINDVRDDLPMPLRVTALSVLTRIAADEYSVAVAGESLSNLYAYQTSWGVLRAVETQAAMMSESEDEAVAQAAAKILNYLATTDPAFGDIKGEGALDMRPSLIYGAAARIELAAIGVR